MWPNPKIGLDLVLVTDFSWKWPISLQTDECLFKISVLSDIGHFEPPAILYHRFLLNFGWPSDWSKVGGQTSKIRIWYFVPKRLRRKDTPLGTQWLKTYYPELNLNINHLKTLSDLYNPRLSGLRGFPGQRISQTIFKTSKSTILSLKCTIKISNSNRLVKKN